MACGTLMQVDIWAGWIRLTGQLEIRPSADGHLKQRGRLSAPSLFKLIPTRSSTERPNPHD